MLMVPKSARAHSIKSRVVPKSAVARERVKIPCVLYCVAHPHTCNTKYEWFILPEESSQPVTANSPVIFVDACACYYCKVTAADGTFVECDSIIVRFVPCELFYISLIS